MFLHLWNLTFGRINKRPHIIFILPPFCYFYSSIPILVIIYFGLFYLFSHVSFELGFFLLTRKTSELISFILRFKKLYFTQRKWNPGLEINIQIRRWRKTIFLSLEYTPKLTFLWEEEFSAGSVNVFRQAHECYAFSSPMTSVQICGTIFTKWKYQWQWE